MTSFTRDDLVNFTPKHPWFVGIDSDGCVFDSMEVKQRQVFHGKIIEFWNLQAVAGVVRRVAVFVNLYSRFRGLNRFPALLKTFDMLRELPEVKAAAVELPGCDSLRRWLDEETRLGNPALAERVAATGDAELRRVLEWSEAVNTAVETTVTDLPPFEDARTCLKRMHAEADLVVVSQTPEEALVREWDCSAITKYVDLIAGQELGTKTEHIQMATNGRYEPGHVLMIGDAPGDHRAAEANDALFYPINPGDEEASWRRLLEEGFDRFLAGTFAGDYADKLLQEFYALLPEEPDW